MKPDPDRRARSASMALLAPLWQLTVSSLRLHGSILSAYMAADVALFYGSLAPMWRPITVRHVIRRLLLAALE